MGESPKSQIIVAKRRFSWDALFTLPWAYLMLPATQLLQSGAAGGLSTSSADIIFMKGYTEEVAGYLSTAQKILPIVLSPAVGLAIDKYGHRFHYVAAAPRSTIMDVVFGVLQDGTEGNGYSKVLVVVIAIKAWAFVLDLAYVFVDYKFLGKGMTMTRSQREARDAQVVDRQADPLTRRTSEKRFTAVTFGLLVAIVASAWAVFVRYLI